MAATLNCTCATSHLETECLPPVTVLIPTYGASEKLLVCLESLRVSVDARTRIVVLDDATPDSSVRDVCEQLQEVGTSIEYVRSSENRGFVRTCNEGLKDCCEEGSDVLLLNSDTEVTPGFLQEMQEVLYLSEKHGVVTPRSNNATIYSIPLTGRRLAAKDSFAVWSNLRADLPRYQVMPTAVGFCMLIRHDILERFDLFDEIYSPGYNEENDFVCRINRYGYSTVAANLAYVFHHESSSFGTKRAELELRNRQILLERYPEYTKKVADYLEFYLDPMERFARLYQPHRPRVLYDLFHVSPHHNGTSDFALNLLRELHLQLSPEADIFVGIRGESLSFFSPELRGYKIFEDEADSDLLFDLVFKPSQVFFWEHFDRMNRLAPRLAFTLQDIIGVRCDYLNSPYRQILFQKVAELSDHVFTISEFSCKDFATFYRLNIPMEVVYHGSSACVRTQSAAPERHVLLMGNAYAHKGVEEALAQIEDLGSIVVLGGDREAVSSRPGVKRLKSGELSRQHLRSLFTNAQLVVYPSFYEGFGLPVLEALAFGRPVIVLESAVNRELAQLAADPNLHQVPSLGKLRSTVERVLSSDVVNPGTKIRNWSDVAQQYCQSFRVLLNRDIDTKKLRERWDLLRLMKSSAMPD